MSDSKVLLTVRAINSQAKAIDIAGDMTAAAEDALNEAFTQANHNGIKAIILNFSDLAYMNSSGIGLLVTMLIRTQRQKQTLLAYGLTEHYRQIFELTRLNEAIGIHNSEAAALASLALPA